MEDIIKQFEQYLEENYDADGKRNTINSYISDIKLFINFFKDYYDEDIIDFSRANVVEYKKYIEKKKSMKYTTINRKMASLSIYENFLIEKGIREDSRKIIKRSDFYKIDRPYITADMLPRKTLRKIILKAGKKSKRDYALFILLDEGGFRISELLEVELDRDVDFDTYYITISGKGKKVRKVAINALMYDALMEYLPEREELLAGRKNKYLFVSNKTANTNKPMGRTTINNLLKEYCHELNEKNVNPHIFRHNKGTTMYEEGDSELKIKKTLGQSSNAVDIYTHPGGENELYPKVGHG